MAFDEAADLIGSCEAQLDEARYGNRVRRVRAETRPRMRVMPNADYTKLPALTAWTQLYEQRLRTSAHHGAIICPRRTAVTGSWGCAGLGRCSWRSPLV